MAPYIHSSPVAFLEHIRLNMLIYAVLCFVCGALLARGLAPQPQFLHPLTYLVLLLYIVTFVLRKQKAGLVLLLVAFSLTGTVHTGYSLLPPADTSHIYAKILNKAKVTLTGTVLNMPEHNGDKTRFNFQADSVLFHRGQAGLSSQEPVQGLIRLSIDSQLPDTISPGDQLMVMATANRTFNYQTPGVFDYRLHMAERSIYVTGKIRSTAEILPFKESSTPSLSRIRFIPERIRQDIGTFLDNRLDPDTAGMYKALLIGSRAGVQEKILEQFKATGTMHLLAISGLHMGLLGLMTVLAATWLLKRSTFILLHTHVPTLATVLSLFPLIGYAFIAGMNTPVFRALIMSALFLVGVVLQRQRSILNITAAAALALLLCRPLALFTVSFQLSFSSVLAIGIIYPRLLNYLEDTHGSIPEFGRYAVTALLVSIAATLGSLPFMLYHFNRVSLIGPFMNLLVEPFLCLWALPIGLFAIPFMYLAPDIAAVLLKIGSAGILTADTITELGSSLPFASIWTITPTPLQITVYFLLLAALFFSSTSSLLRAGALVCFILFSGSFTSGLWLQTPPSKTEVTFLDIGQGNATFISLRDGRTILLDGGTKTSSNFDVGERVISPFLRRKQIWRLDDVIISHPDSDHYNGLAFILDHFSPKRLWINKDDTHLPAYRSLLNHAKEKGIEIIGPLPGQTLYQGAGSRVSFLTGAQVMDGSDNPDRSAGNLSVNDRSLVVKLVQGNVSFLFPGDLGFRGEEIVLEGGSDIRADVLLAGHHGSRGSSSTQFIKTVDPGIIVVSSGRNIQGPYLDKDHLKNWQDAGKQVLATALHGTIFCLTDGRTLEVDTYNEK